MIESEIKEFSNLIAHWRAMGSITGRKGKVFNQCATHLENVLDSLAPPVDPIDAMDKTGWMHGEPHTDDNMLERFDEKTCPECGKKIEET